MEGLVNSQDLLKFICWNKQEKMHWCNNNVEVNIKNLNNKIKVKETLLNSKVKEKKWKIQQETLRLITETDQLKPQNRMH